MLKLTDRRPDTVQKSGAEEWLWDVFGIYSFRKFILELFLNAKAGRMLTGRKA